MERKTRTEASIPAIAVTRKELIKSGYEVVKNKEGKGFILSREGFKLSGLTGREVYIASIIIKQERKFYYDTAYIAEAVAAAAQRQNQSSNSEAGQDQSKD